MTHTVLVVLAILGGAFLLFIALSIWGRQQCGWTAADTAKSAAQMISAPYWYRCLVALDLFANVLLRGMYGMTLSSRIAIWAAMKRGGVVGWFVLTLLKMLDRLQPDHGTEALSGDVARNTVANLTMEPWLTRETVGAVTQAVTAAHAVTVNGK